MAHDVQLRNPGSVFNISLASASGANGVIAQSQDEQTEAIVGKETLQGTGTAQQDEQAQAIAGKETLLGAGLAIQDEQAEAIAGKETLTGAIVEVQNEQAENIAGKETLFSLVTQSQDEQAEALAGNQVVGAIAVVAEAQAEQAEILAGQQAAPVIGVAHGFLGVEYKKPKEKKRHKPLQPILGAVASTSAIQTEEATGTRSFAGKGNSRQVGNATCVIGNISFAARGRAVSRRRTNQEEIRGAIDYSSYIIRLAEIQNLRGKEKTVYAAREAAYLARLVEIQNLKEEAELLALIV